MLFLLGAFSSSFFFCSCKWEVTTSPNVFANVFFFFFSPNLLGCYHPLLHISRKLTSSENKPGDDLNKHYEWGQRKWLLGWKVQALGNRSLRLEPCAGWGRQRPSGGNAVAQQPHNLSWVLALSLSCLKKLFLGKKIAKNTQWTRPKIIIILMEREIKHPLLLSPLSEGQVLHTNASAHRFILTWRRARVSVVVSCVHGEAAVCGERSCSFSPPFEAQLKSIAASLHGQQPDCVFWHLNARLVGNFPLNPLIAHIPVERTYISVGAGLPYRVCLHDLWPLCCCFTPQKQCHFTCFYSVLCSVYLKWNTGWNPSGWLSDLSMPHKYQCENIPPSPHRMHLTLFFLDKTTPKHSEAFSKGPLPVGRAPS